jgi:hypothetical protein
MFDRPPSSSVQTPAAGPPAASKKDSSAEAKTKIARPVETTGKITAPTPTKPIDPAPVPATPVFATKIAVPTTKPPNPAVVKAAVESSSIVKRTSSLTTGQKPSPIKLQENAASSSQTAKEDSQKIDTNKKQQQQQSNEPNTTQAPAQQKPPSPKEVPPTQKPPPKENVATAPKPAGAIKPKTVPTVETTDGQKQAMPETSNVSTSANDTQIPPKQEAGSIKLFGPKNGKGVERPMTSNEKEDSQSNRMTTESNNKAPPRAPCLETKQKIPNQKAESSFSQVKINLFL